jgi:hypothetical protein
MDLNDQIWPTLEGGYRIPYDASVILKELEATSDAKAINHIFLELWDNLHHQGDVGAASYLSSTSLIDICIRKNSLDWNYIGLCLIIEHCRRSDNNPKIPNQFNDDYFNALSRFEEYLLNNFKAIDDPTSLRLTLAFFATMHDQFDLGRAIEELDEDVLAEFLERD